MTRASAAQAEQARQPLVAEAVHDERRIAGSDGPVTESEFQIFEAVGALVVVLEADGRIVYWNHGCSDLSGYALEEVRGRKLWDFLLLPEEVEPLKAVFGTLPTSTRPSPHANHWVTRTGERRWIAFSHTVTRDEDGRPQYVIKTGIDRSESKQVAEASRASEAKLTEQMAAALSRSEDDVRELRAIAELREQFIGIVGHDLRNPLGTIALATEVLLERGLLDEEDRSGVARIVASSERMTRMILQLLDFTRARLGGGISLDAKRIDLRDVCRNVVEEFGSSVSMDVEGDVTGTWDADRLTDAISNITRNATEHAAPGTPIVARARPEGAAVVVEITNRGDPIPADLLPVIFDPFRRGHHARSSTGNLGLGLYIASQIALASGGTLDARSGDGSTTFVMRLPRTR